MKGLWATFPPSGGGHYHLWAVWGFYTKPVNPRQVVHNEEHGAIVIWWGPKVPGLHGGPAPRLLQRAGLGRRRRRACSARRSRRSRASRSETRLRSPPGPRCRARTTSNDDYGIGHVAICPSFNKHAFTVFRDAYRGKGPEGIPLIPYDEPGMGPNELTGRVEPGYVPIVSCNGRGRSVLMDDLDVDFLTGLEG